jgi:hypothetical protein
MDGWWMMDDPSLNLHSCTTSALNECEGPKNLDEITCHQVCPWQNPSRDFEGLAKILQCSWLNT